MAPIRSPDGWLVTEGEGYSERINLGRGREQVLWDALKDLLVPMREAFEMVEAAGCAVELRPVKHYLTWQLDAISSVVFRDLRAASFPFRSPSSALQVNPLLLRFLVQRGYFDPAAVAAVQTRALGGRSEPLEVEDAWECVAGLVGLMEGHDRYYGSIETGLNDDGGEFPLD
ncbi:hypothetical protein M427DRAFT_384546 [Gonapodya prolifera JEL478]|uniref:Uncharacterized protein n=1 Tax=Gonapodya prolifera (strain JEL478) TaxID=1344416 RepID=A0A139A896_GONPJ|nr:hypothetical protein M427DRAFT_384546 [Gonapodya prolifera JEL478]|eukprot:KXS13026.1 hypothetical protein M427DRAFT_384546 [Gonapodya prolifera JEL478]